MHNYHTSYRARKRRKINDICAKMREAKERKRLEQDYARRNSPASAQTATAGAIIIEAPLRQAELKL